MAPLKPGLACQLLMDLGLFPVAEDPTMAYDFDPAYLRAATDELRRAGLDKAADWMLEQIEFGEQMAEFADRMMGRTLDRINRRIADDVMARPADWVEARPPDWYSDLDPR